MWLCGNKYKYTRYSSTNSYSNVSSHNYGTRNANVAAILRFASVLMLWHYAALITQQTTTPRACFRNEYKSLPRCASLRCVLSASTRSVRFEKHSKSQEMIERINNIDSVFNRVLIRNKSRIPHFSHPLYPLPRGILSAYIGTDNTAH